MKMEVLRICLGLLLRLGRKGISAGISWCIYEELIKSNYFQSKFLLKKGCSIKLIEENEITCI